MFNIDDFAKINPLDVAILRLQETVERHRLPYKVIREKDDLAFFEIGVLWMCGEERVHLTLLSSILERFHARLVKNFLEVLKEDRDWILCQNWKADYCFECAHPPFGFINHEKEESHEG